MARTMCVCAMLAVALSTAPVGAQDEVEQLRGIMAQLQGKLDALAARKELDDGRVTQIGSSRIRVYEDQEPSMIVRIYDLSDLFAVAPPYVALRSNDLGQTQQPIFPTVQGEPVGAGGFGGGGGFFNVHEGSPPQNVQPRTVPPAGAAPAALYQFSAGGSNLSAAQTSMDDLIGAITSTIAPEEWDEVGGPGSIASLGNSLLISASESTHAQIDALLRLFRKKWGSLRTVSVRAYWIWLSDSQLAELVQPQPVGDENAPIYGVVPDEKWSNLLADLAQVKEGRRVGFRAAVTCYNGQTVHTMSGRQQLLVTGVTPVIGDGEGVGYRPTVSVVQEGAVLQVTPMPTSTGKYVVLDIHSRVNEFRPTTAVEDRQADGGQASQLESVVAAIDRPTLLTHRLSTTLRVPADLPMLVGGMTYESEPQPGDPNLYLFVKISVQELRDDQADEETEAPTKEEGGADAAPTDDPAAAPPPKIDPLKKQ